MYYGTPPIVTNGLILNLDSLNTLSIPLDPTVNLVPRPNDPTLWGNGGGVQITASNAIAPDGTLTASTIAFTGSGAYFAYVTSIGATTGSQYTTSVYVKMVSGSTINFNWGGVHGGNRTTFTFDFSTGTISNISAASGEIYGAEQAANGFWRLYASSTMNAGTALNYYPQLNVSLNNIFLIWGTQIERNRYATPLASGSRTAWINIANLPQTASLLTGSISSSIPSFRSLKEGVLTFDGSGSYSGINNIYSGYSSSATEVVFSFNQFVSSSGFTSIGGYDSNVDGTYYSAVGGLVYIDNATKRILSSVITTSQTYRTVTSTTTLNTGSYYHVVLNKDTVNGNLELYVNGRLESTNTFDPASYGQWPTTGSFVVSNNINISNTRSVNASWTNTKYLNGKIPVFKLYNKILSQNEVLQNYNAYKTRFNLR